MSLAIKVENLSKVYRLGEIGTGSLRSDFERWVAKARGKEDPFLMIGETNDRATKGTTGVVWSLKDINFEIKKGDAVGIIGRNGAGKSTLLKILSRVTSPSTGEISIKGRIASLLEVGTGFHPELTGRENIFLNGAILGMKKREIHRKFDEIVDFAGVERYIDTPVKRYSSGMYVRLAFAVAAHLESETLIVDEVLAVGDAEFQKKCLGKMGDVSKGEGRTVLFVSHQMSSIRKLCNKCILLNNGEVQMNDRTDVVVKAYMNDGSGEKNIKHYDRHLNYFKVEQVGEQIIVEAAYDGNTKYLSPHFGFVIYDGYHQPVFGSNPRLDIIDTSSLSNSRKGLFKVAVNNPKLVDGEYYASVWFSGDGITDLLEDHYCISFTVTSMSEKLQYVSAVSGSVVPGTRWELSRID